MDLLFFIWTILFINCLRKPDGNLYCGLVGGSSSKTPLDVMKLKMLFLDNIERGEDSTGFYDGDQLWKEPGKANKVLLPFDLISHDTNLFIGHTRKKTIGLTNKANAHPFQFEGKDKKPVIGAHNGTLQNWDKLREYYDFDDKEVDMDSKVIFKALAAHGSCQVFEDLMGAAAVIFTRNDGRLYVWRNRERPLFRGYIDQGEKDRQMYISSLKEGLLGIGCKDVKEFKTECLYIIKDGNVEKTKKIRNKNRYSYHELNNLLRKKNGVEETTTRRSSGNQQNKTNAYKDTNIGPHQRNVNPAMDESSKEMFGKNDFTPTIGDDTIGSKEDANIEHAGGVCAMTPAISSARRQSLEDFHKRMDDNYVSKDQETEENNEDMQDLQSEYSIENVPFSLVENSMMNFEDVVDSGMKTESLFLTCQKLYNYLKDLRECIDELDKEALWEGKEGLLESLKTNSDKVSVMLMESLKS